MTAAKGDGYASGARILSVGIASTGAVTFAYFSVASYALGEVQYKRLALLWAVMFVIVSVIYRPIEQLLSRTIAERRARGLDGGHPLRVPMLIQAAFAAVFLVVALAVRRRVRDDVFDGSEALYWILVGGVLAYAASYFARGWLAGHQRFGLYGGLVLLESCSRFVFALAAVVGITHGQAAVALGMAAAPFVSLVVVPWAFSRRDPRAGERLGARLRRPLRPSDPRDPTAAVATPGRLGARLRRPLRPSDPRDPTAAVATPGAGVEEAEGGLSLRHGAGFAVSVLVVMLAEQTLINGAVLTVDATSSDAALAGIVFSVLLIARAPLQLFQAVQGTLLPHLAGLEATAGRREFARAIRITVLAIAAFAVTVALGLFALGPFALGVLFDVSHHYARGGLALLALGVGCHLAAGTLNQAALARGQASQAAFAWLLAAAAFLGWMVAPAIDDQLLRAEVGYLGATTLLCAALAALYRAGSRVPTGARGR